MLNNFEAFAAHFKPTADKDRKALAAMYNEDTESSSESDTESSSESEEDMEEDYYIVSRHSIATMIKHHAQGTAPS